MTDSITPDVTEKSWYASRTIWSAIGAALSFLLANVIKAPQEQVDTLVGKLVDFGPDVIGTILTIFTIIFRMKANKTIT